MTSSPASFTALTTGVRGASRVVRVLGCTALLCTQAWSQSLVNSGGATPSSGVQPLKPPTVFAPSPQGGGQYHAPPDAGSPPGGSEPTPSGSTVDQPGDQRGQRPPTASPGTTPFEAQPGGAGSKLGGQKTPTTSVEADGWESWWETNKFDFIELRRMDDPVTNTQGAAVESPARRELRLAGVRASVRDRVLPALRELTGSQDAAVRAAAIVALGKLHDQDSIELAKALLSDPSFEVRRSSMLALGMLTSGRAAWLLLHIADDSQHGRALLGSSPVSVDDRGIALLSACLRGDQAAQQLLAQLLAEHGTLQPELIALTADAAGLLGSPDLIRPLVQVAFDESTPQYVRSAATSALGRIGDPSVTPALIELLEQDLEPRRAAVIALGEVGHPGATSVIDRLTALLQHDGDAATRHFAAISLGRIGGGHAQRSLEQSLAKAGDDMRPWIVLGLGLCERSEPTGTVAPRLMDMCRSESNSSTHAALLVALGLTRSPDALPLLVQRLGSATSQVGGAAALGLGLSGRRDAVEPLRGVLTTSSDPEVLRQTALALGILGDAASQKDLLELVRTSSDPYVASFAGIGVAFLGDNGAAGPLLELIRRSGPNGLATTYAVTALGQLFDTDRRPALSRLAAGDNYLARTTAVDDLLALGF